MPAILYLHSLNNGSFLVSDKRSIVYTINRAKQPLIDKPEIIQVQSDGNPIVENKNGNILIEQFTDRKTGNAFWYVISAEMFKSINSDWVKRFVG